MCLRSLIRTYCGIIFLLIKQTFDIILNGPITEHGFPIPHFFVWVCVRSRTHMSTCGRDSFWLWMSYDEGRAKITLWLYRYTYHYTSSSINKTACGQKSTQKSYLVAACAHIPKLWSEFYHHWLQWKNWMHAIFSDPGTIISA